MIQYLNIGNINLIYHSSFKEIPEELRKTIHNVTPQNILKQALLFKKYLDIISIDELFSLPIKERDGKVSITFDDGYNNIFDEILVKLSDNSVPVTVFLVGNSLNKKPYWRDKVIFLNNNKKYLIEFIKFFQKNTNIKFNINNFFQESKQSNINSLLLDKALDKFFKIHDLNEKVDLNLVTDPNKLIKNKFIKYGNHTTNHYVMSSLTYDEQKKEILNNKNYLASLNIQMSDVFALPFGTYQDINFDTIKILKELNINKVLLCGNTINNSNNYFEIDNIKFLDRLTPSNNIYRVIYNMLKIKIANQNLKSKFTNLQI